MFHISDIKKYQRCPKLYYLDSLNKNNNYFSYARNDYQLLDILKKHFNFDDCYIGMIGDDALKVIDNLDKYDYFYNARFSYNDMRIKPTLLHKTSDAYDLYIFKIIHPKDLSDIQLSIMYDVLIHNNILINNIFYICCNKEYVFKDTLNCNNVVEVFDTINGIKLLDYVKNNPFDYLSIINDIKKFDINTFVMNPSSNCKLKIECNYLKDCYKDIIKDNSILNLVSSHDKYDMYNEGILDLKDADINRIDATKLQYAQIMADRNNGQFIDYYELEKFMNSINSFPISFIDFEWDTFMFPKYNGMKCFDVLPFEFSLVIIDHDIEKKYTFVGKGDCREDFIKALIKQLPNNGPIVAYNSFSAEVLRLKELSISFSQYKKELDNIIKRFVDIAEVFTNGIIYKTIFNGELSLKKIVSCISDLNYDNLDVSNGLEAVECFRKYENDGKEEDKEKLIKYCEQDAYSLVVIYKYLNTLLKSR